MYFSQPEWLELIRAALEASFVADFAVVHPPDGVGRETNRRAGGLGGRVSESLVYSIGSLLVKRGSSQPADCVHSANQPEWLDRIMAAY
ncbi:MAG: hypothetical protein ISS79_04560 [Phycisphaerae bacterium]|nr:hypothetical protein [Phycisphaerae bacterium]